MLSGHGLALAVVRILTSTVAVRYAATKANHFHIREHFLYAP